MQRYTMPTTWTGFGLPRFAFHSIRTTKRAQRVTPEEAVGDHCSCAAGFEELGDRGQGMCQRV